MAALIAIMLFSLPHPDLTRNSEALQRNFVLQKNGNVCEMRNSITFSKLYEGDVREKYIVYYLNGVEYEIDSSKMVNDEVFVRDIYHIRSQTIYYVDRKILLSDQSKYVARYIYSGNKVTSREGDVPILKEILDEDPPSLNKLKVYGIKEFGKCKDF